MKTSDISMAKAVCVLTVVEGAMRLSPTKFAALFNELDWRQVNENRPIQELEASA